MLLVLDDVNHTFVFCMFIAQIFVYMCMMYVSS